MACPSQVQRAPCKMPAVMDQAAEMRSGAAKSSGKKASARRWPVTMLRAVPGAPARVWERLGRQGEGSCDEYFARWDAYLRLRWSRGWQAAQPRNHSPRPLRHLRPSRHQPRRRQRPSRRHLRPSRRRQRPSRRRQRPSPLPNRPLQDSHRRHNPCLCSPLRRKFLRRSRRCSLRQRLRLSRQRLCSPRQPLPPTCRRLPPRRPRQGRS